MSEPLDQLGSDAELIFTPGGAFSGAELRRAAEVFRSFRARSPDEYVNPVTQVPQLAAVLRVREEVSAREASAAV